MNAEEVGKEGGEDHLKKNNSQLGRCDNENRKKT